MSGTAARRPSGADLSSRDFRWFADLVYEASGIVLSEAKSQLVYSRLAKRVRARGCADVPDYLTLIAKDATEREAAVYALTTNHTKFFREDHHFDHFRDVVWPGLEKRLHGGGKARLWSAACSSGEEPYTLVMTALGADRRAGEAVLRSDLRILATDLAPHVLATAKAGRYPADILQAIPKPLAAAWVAKAAGGGCEIAPAARRAIAFKQLNLLGDWPMRGTFDAIFCRNVMIYFDEPTKARLQERLARQLVPGGHLYIGHSERLIGPVEGMLTSLGHTIYRRNAE